MVALRIALKTASRPCAAAISRSSARHGSAGMLAGIPAGGADVSAPASAETIEVDPEGKIGAWLAVMRLVGAKYSGEGVSAPKVCKYNDPHHNGVRQSS